MDGTTIVFISYFGPKNNGLSVFNRDIVESIKSINWIITPTRGYLNLLMIPLKLLIFRTKTNKIYYTLGDTTSGIIKDLYILIPSFLLQYKVLAHSHSGAIVDYRDRLLGKFIIDHLVRKVIVLIPTIVDTSSRYIYVPNTPREEFYNFRRKKIFDPEKIQLCFFSNFQEEKGVKWIIDLAKHFQGEGTYKFHLIGDGDLVDSDISERLPNVKVVQLANVNEIIAYLGQMDVMILPTTYKTEAYPLSIIESLFCGVKVISTNRGAISNILDEQLFGKILDTDHLWPSILNSTREVIRELKANPELSLNIQELAREKWKRTEFLSTMKNLLVNFDDQKEYYPN